ncbi:hypothetical protein AB4Y40_41620 [Paraburkholderia sp. EG287B]|uniref:hypothetical protein n=1 Tax=Paraburkholderia sp. EG287B TaxID=3237010 RepID=UPI0034D242E0
MWGLGLPRDSNPTAHRFELVSLALLADSTPKSVLSAFGRLIWVAWPGVSRAHLVDCVRRLDMRASLQVQPGFVTAIYRKRIYGLSGIQGEAN